MASAPVAAGPVVAPAGGMWRGYSQKRRGHAMVAAEPARPDRDGPIDAAKRALEARAGGHATAAAAARSRERSESSANRTGGRGELLRWRIARPARRAPNASDGAAALAARVAPVSERKRQNLFVERSRGLSIATRARASRSAAQKFLHLCRRYLLQWVAVETNCALALFRTCLWPCVGRWASGQEAGQPPGVRSPRRRVERTQGLRTQKCPGT